MARLPTKRVPGTNLTDTEPDVVSQHALIISESEPGTPDKCLLYLCPEPCKPHYRLLKDPIDTSMGRGLRLTMEDTRNRYGNQYLRILSAETADVTACVLCGFLHSVDTALDAQRCVECHGNPPLSRLPVHKYRLDAISTRAYQYSEGTTLKFSVDLASRHTFTTLLWKTSAGYDYLTSNLEKGREYEIPQGFVVSETNRGLLGVKTVFTLFGAAVQCAEEEEEEDEEPTSSTKSAATPRKRKRIIELE